MERALVLSRMDGAAFRQYSVEVEEVCTQLRHVEFHFLRVGLIEHTQVTKYLLFIIACIES